MTCGESREQVEVCFGEERLKVTKGKREYMCVNECEASGKTKLQGVEVEKVDEFKYQSQPSKVMDSTAGGFV